MAKSNAKTKVITGKNTRLSYFHGWEPASINDGAEKYSTSVLIPKTDTETVDAINKAIDAAIEEGIAKFGGKKPIFLKYNMRDLFAAQVGLQEARRCRAFELTVVRID